MKALPCEMQNNAIRYNRIQIYALCSAQSSSALFVAGSMQSVPLHTSDFIKVLSD